MKALTLDQPYASLVVDGIKTIETRSWPPPREMDGLTVAIHSSAKKSLTGATGCVLGTVAVVGAFRIGQLHTDGPRGFVTRTGNEDDRRGITHPSVPIDDYGDFTPGRWVWLLFGPKRIWPPLPARGRQRLWDLTDEQVQTIRNRYLPGNDDG